jgi:hypothetical protein
MSPWAVGFLCFAAGFILPFVLVTVLARYRGDK